MASKHIYTFFCLACLLVSGIELRAQVALDSIPITGDWESAGFIQDSPDMRVEIEYRLQKNSCDVAGFGNTNHQFRFKIESLKKILGFDRYLTFKIMFEDCSGVLICKTVNLNVGVKQKNDRWDGIQPLLDPNSDNSFTGRRLIKAFYDVNLRWEKDPTKDSECLLVNPAALEVPSGGRPTGGVTKPGTPRPPMIYEMASSIGIKAKKLNCPGAEVAFYPNGGKKDDLIKYHWSKNTCEGEQIWTGDTLVVSPTETTAYYLKMVGPKAPSKCISINYVVNPLPVNNLNYNKNVLPNQGGIIINIERSEKISSIPVSWYWDSIDPEHRFASNEFLLIDKEFKPGKKYYYRFENACGASNAKLVTFADVNWSSEPLPDSNTNVQSETTAVVGSNQTEQDAIPEAAPEQKLPVGEPLVAPATEVPASNISVYVGGGILSGGNSAIQPFYAMAGVGKADAFKIYVRYKKAGSGTLGTVSSTLETNNTKITNFPVNTNTYYVISDKAATQRVSYTVGYMKEFPGFNIYVGGGMGNNQVYWNAQTYSYASPGLLVSDTWVKNKVQSANGLEGEVGGTVKFKNFNLQGGVSFIKGVSSLYISADFGVGITF